MPDTVSWLHISDIHLRDEHDHWSRDVVLKDLLRDIKTRADKLDIRFVIMSGDLAFAGKSSEYELISVFFDDLLEILNLSRKELFFVAGNHDIYRDTAKLCYHGAAATLVDAQSVDQLIGDKPELKLLLRRLAYFNHFHKKYSPENVIRATPEGLAYTSRFAIDGLPFIIVGLNSSWVSNGGTIDNQNLLIGDRQVINVADTLRQLPPAITLGIVHHPLEWLKDFDRQSVILRLLPMLDVLHCGHIHDPSSISYLTSIGNSCIQLIAGAAYESRTSMNTYSHVTLDLTQDKLVTQVYCYQSDSGKYDPGKYYDMPMERPGCVDLPIDLLAVALVDIDPSISIAAHYIAGILTGRTVEVPILIDSSIQFIPDSLLGEADDDASIAVCRKFLALRRILAYSQPKDLDSILSINRDAIIEFASHLSTMCDKDALINTQLVARNSGLSQNSSQNLKPISIQFMKRLVDECRWTELNEAAIRLKSSPNDDIAHMAHSYEILSLAKSGDTNNHIDALKLTQEHLLSGTIDDVLIACLILNDMNEHELLKNTIVDAHKRFPESFSLFAPMAKSFALDHGDSDIRKLIEDSQ